MGAGREREAEAAFRRALDLDCDNIAAAENLESMASSSAGVEGVSETRERNGTAVSVAREPAQPEK